MDNVEMLPLFRNKKTGKVYYHLGEVVNATNENDGQKMVIYREKTNCDSYTFVREKSEFFEKFTNNPE